jgi:hypothetical protein
MGDRVGTDDCRGVRLADVDVVPRFGLGGRREDREGQSIGFA